MLLIGLLRGSVEHCRDALAERQELFRIRSSEYVMKTDHAQGAECPGLGSATDFFGCVSIGASGGHPTAGQQ